VKGLAGYLAYRAASALVGVLPEAVMRRTGEGAGWIASFLSPGKLDLVKRNLVRVVGGEAATTARARRMFKSYGRYWAEVFWVRPRRVPAILAHSVVQGEEHILAARDAGRGVIVALPHLGNWEAAGPQARRLGVPMLAAAEALPNPRIVEWFVETRGRLGIDVVIVGRDRSATQKLIERLREGGAIALVSDRDLAGRGVEVELFDERTTLPAGPVALADRTGAALLPVGCYFNVRRGHHFVVEPPIEIPDIADKDVRIAAATQLYADKLEDLIRRAPEQWHLFQPNWPSDKAAP
jgi:KDO2-lipid IV(A) lauroyltransferase